uniref:Transmembrane protein n=1 Tax=Medicago truncatula TaxID=3880 RepID=I3S3E7_MEDTR|nr:unknown [Medicago truncatula]
MNRVGFWRPMLMVRFVLREKMSQKGIRTMKKLINQHFCLVGFIPVILVTLILMGICILWVGLRNSSTEEERKYHQLKSMLSFLDIKT